MPADRQVLEVSDRVHELARAAVESARPGSFPAPPTPDAAAALVRARTPAGDIPVRLQAAPLYDPQRLRILDR